MSDLIVKSKEFFQYRVEPDVGYPLFGREHLTLLLAMAVLCLSICLIFRFEGDRRQRKPGRAVAWLILILLVLRMLILFVQGEMSVYELPLHLCSITGVLCLVHSYTGWKWCEEVLYTLGLPGAMLALIFPNATYYPVIHFITLQSFLFHALIVAYVAGNLFCRRIIPAVRRAWMPMLFLILISPGIYRIDQRYNVNYMFLLEPSSGSPLELLFRITGEAYYILGLCVVIFLIILIMEALYCVLKRK